MTIVTGTRTISGSGSWTGSCTVYLNPVGPDSWFAQVTDANATLMGLAQFSMHGHIGPDGLFEKNLSAHLNVAGGGGDVTSDSWSDGGFLGFGYQSFSTAGSWTFSVDCEELDDQTEGAAFPIYGGPLVEDPPYETTNTVWLRTRVGGSLTFSVTAFGRTLSLHVAITPANQATIASYLSTLGLAAGSSAGVGARHALSATHAGTVNGQAIGAPRSYTYNNTTCAGDAGCSIAIAAVGNNGGAIMSVASQPHKEATLQIAVQRFGESYGGNVDVRVQEKAGPATLETIAGTASIAISQACWSISADIEDLAANLHHFGESLDETCDLCCWVDSGWLSANGFDARDWRCLLQGQPFAAITLSQAAQTTVDSCGSLTPGGDWAGTWEAVSGCTVDLDAGSVRIVVAPGDTGSARRRFHNGANTQKGGLSGYRYLHIGLPDGGLGTGARAVIGSKEWGVGTVLDLCIPDNSTATYDLHDTRWPAPGPSGSPSGDGAYWGVDNVEEIRFENIPPGTYHISELRLDRDALSLGRKPRVSALPALDAWVQASPTTYSGAEGQIVTTDYCRRFLWADTDHRQSLEQHDCYKTIVETPTVETTTFVEFTLRDMVGFVNAKGVAIDDGAVRHPGWSASLACPDEPDHPQDGWTGYLNRNRPAYWLASPILRGAPPGWEAQMDLDASAAATLNAAVRFDRLRWYPGCGDTFGIGGGNGLVVGAAHVFGARPWGIVSRPGPPPGPLPLARVRVIDLEPPGGEVSNGLSGDDGGYVTGMAYPLPHAHRLRAENMADAVQVDVTLRTRMSQRACFRLNPAQEPEAGPLEVDHPRQWLHVAQGPAIQTYSLGTGRLLFSSPDHPLDRWEALRTDPRRGTLACLGIDGTAHRLYLSLDGGYSITEITNVTARTARIERDSERGCLLWLYEDSAGVFGRISRDGGASWEAPIPCMGPGGPLDGQILDTAQDARQGGAIYLLLLEGTNAVLYVSHDLGQTFSTV